MKKLLLAGLLLSGLAACSPPTPLTVEEDDKPAEIPAYAAVATYLTQTLDAPASYQPAHWGSPKAWRKDDANRLDLDSLKKQSNMFYNLLKSERNARVVSESDFDKTAAILRQLQRKQDSLVHTADSTRLGVVISHAYRAKNKLGALQLDSAQFIVYKNGKVEKLEPLLSRWAFLWASTFSAFRPNVGGVVAWGHEKPVTIIALMVEYKVSSDSSRHFNLTKNGRVLGELTYEKWFSFEATIHLPDDTPFQIKPKGFWGTTIELQQSGVTLLHFSMGWSGHIIIQSDSANQQQDFVFKQRGFFKNEYALMDSQGLELLVVRPDFKWRELNYEYSITTTDFFEALSLKDALLLLMTHCANYYMTMMMAAA